MKLSVLAGTGCMSVMLFSLILASASSQRPSVPEGGTERGTCNADVRRHVAPPVDAAISALRSKTTINPIMIHGDPYAPTEDPGPRSAPAVGGEVCGLRYLDGRKETCVIQTFANEHRARASGFIVTHYGPCGTCSTLRDLAVYLQYPDLTAIARRCSFLVARRTVTRCLEHYGFTAPCALTWYYNIRHTRRHCLRPCLRSWLMREPSNQADGRLNPCLQCDEDESGPVFKMTAGRTRRNSGIVSSIRRGEGEIRTVVHDYY